MDFDQLKSTLSSLANLIDDGEKIKMHIFASKLASASELYPEDQTIGQMADIVARMSDRKVFITRAEIKSLYNKLYTRNTKFAEVFANDLGDVQKSNSLRTKTYDRSQENTNDIVAEAYEKIVDPTLANALNQVFGNKSTGYSKSAAKNAKSLCSSKCVALQLAYDVDVECGDENFIICRASFETPRGLTSVFFPVEIVKDSEVLIPSVFVGNRGAEDFSGRTLQNYVATYAGKAPIFTSDMVLKVANNAKFGLANDVNNVDLAIIKLNSTRDSKATFVSSDNVLGQKLEKTASNLEVGLPKYNDKDIDNEFSKVLNSTAGVANFQFGNENISRGRDLIVRKLSSFGAKNPQVSVVDASNENSVVYAVSVNGGTGFKVPVKITGGKVFEPTVMICGSSIEAFSKEGLNSIINNKLTDVHMEAVASPWYGSKSSELVEIVRVSAENGKYEEAEEILNVLAEGNDMKAYAVAMNMYKEALSGKKSVEKTGCSMVVKNANSSKPICGHTGLTLDKVVQDKHGNCVPAYRQNMENSSEGGGAYLQSSKIFF